MRRSVHLSTWLLIAFVVGSSSPSKGQALAPEVDHVVVATFDTGANPFHPCFRRDWEVYKELPDDVITPRDFIPNYPADATELPLQMATSYAASLQASQPALNSIKSETLHYVPGTNLSYYGEGPQARLGFIDTRSHGASASSQIACDDYGMGANSHLVVLNWYDPAQDHWELVDWVISQTWIDIVHLNIQDIPRPAPGLVQDHFKRLIEAGKLVVIAAGNGVVPGEVANYPMELSSYTGWPGSLVVGANDNGGWQLYSNLNPHVVMDGSRTVAAAADSFGERSFGGTSSASPLVTGYAAQVVGRLRATFGHTWQGLVTIPDGRPRPVTGPLADGTLTAAELHEVIRRTANPHSHDSRYDGGTSPLYWMPEPAGLPFAFYPKVGYGEVSEHTIDLAVRVLAGLSSMPPRPHEDALYEQSEAVRHLMWGRD